MRLTTFILMIALAQVSARGFGQKITLNEINAPIEKILQSIKNQSGYGFIYNVKDLDNRKVTLKLKDATIEEAVKSLTKNLQLNYKIVSKDIVLTREEPTLLDKLANVIQSVTKNLTVKGRVVDQDGRPLPNASIRIKGKSTVTNTNQNGEFELKDVADDAILQISYVGFKTLEISVKDAVMPLQIRLDMATGELKEVNVTYSTGYQRLNKDRATGSFVLVDSNLLNRRVGTNILDRLDGVTSGLVFNTNPNAGVKEPAISIRTRSTLFSNTDPLIVVDNFPYTGDMSTINPNDIENITILKDAAAASIWGAYSGNGVIVITTKKGRYNKPLNMVFNSNVTITEKPDLYYTPKLGSANYLEFEEYLFNNGYYTSNENSALKPALSPAVEIFIQRRDKEITPEQALAQLEALKNTDTRNDLSRYFYRPAVNQQYNLNFSGGSANQQYFFSAGYDKNLQSLKGNDFGRISLNANNTYALMDKRLEISTGISFSRNNTQSNGSSAAGANEPYLNLVDENGKAMTIANAYRLAYLDTVGRGKLLDWGFRPYEELNLHDNQTQLTDYRLNAGLKFKIIKGLDLNLKYQYNKGIAETKELNKAESFFARNLINQYTQISSTGTLTRPIPLGGVLDKTNNFFEAHNLRADLGYSNSWKNEHEVNAIIGAEVNKRDASFESNRQYGYDEALASGTLVNYFADYPTYPLMSLNKIFNPAQTLSNYDRRISYFANASYTYKGRYTLSASARKDEANLFGVATNQKGVPLWSAGAIWEISKEPFYSLDALPFLKIRLTKGYNGNVNSSLSAVTVVGVGSINRYNAPTFFIANPPNSLLRWEKIQNLNAAIDFGFKNNRVSGSIEYYKKKSKDLIGTSPIDPTTGVTTFTGNTANTEGRGIDLTLNTLNTRELIKWNTNFLFSYAKDKVTNYDLKINGLTGLISGGILNPVVGNPALSVYSYKWAGLDALNGDPQGYLNGKISKDYNGLRNSTDLNNLKYHGPARPTAFGAIRNSLQWRQLEVSFNIKYSFNYFFKVPVIGYTNILAGSALGGNDAAYAGRWKSPGDELTTNIPSLVNPNSANAAARDQFYQNAEINVEKGDHIRFQDIKLSLQLPAVKGKWLSFNHMQVYGYVNNLGIIWKATKSELDPDYFTGIPNPRSYAIGFSANF